MLLTVCTYFNQFVHSEYEFIYFLFFVKGVLIGSGASLRTVCARIFSTSALTFHDLYFTLKN